MTFAPEGKLQLHARAGSVTELPYDVGMGGDMGYFRGLTSSSFKTTEDGRRLFYPWGVLGRGYLVGSEENYGRLRKQMKTYIVVSVVLIIVAPSLFRGFNLGVSAALAGVCLAFYLTWMCILLPSLNATDEGLSLKESMTSQARAHGPIVLWLLTIVSLVLVAGGVLMFVAQPGSRLIALVPILFFGFCAALFIRMLLLRRTVV